MKFSRAKLQHLKWVRRKELIRINCFIMIAILLMVLLFMGFPIVSSADEFIGLGSKYFYKDIFIREDFESYNGVSGYYNIGSTYFNRLKLYFVPESDIDSYYNDVSTIFKYFDLSQVDSRVIDSNYNYNLFIYVYQNNLYVAFGTSYCQLKDLDSQKVISGPSLIYNFNPSTHQITNTPNQQNCDYLLLATGNVRSIMYSDNFNYLLIDNDTGNSPGGNMIGPNINDIITNHKLPYDGSCVYMQYSNLNTGNMHVVVKSDEFQKTENASIKLKCSVSAQTQYNSSVGIQESNVGVDGPFQNNFSSPNETFNNGPYVEFEIPLSSFNNSGDYTISLEDINKGLWNSNEKTLYSFNSCFQNNSTGLATAFKTFFFSILSTQNIIPDYSNMPNFLYSLNSEVWDVQGVFCIGESEEIFDSFQLDMISGDIENQDYALPNEDDIKNALDIQTVPNNYVPQPYKPSYPDAYNVTVPNNNTDVNNDINNNSQDNDNITVSGGENSVNVVTNINQGNKYPEKGVMQSFVRIINNDKNNTVNDVDTLISGSSYLALMNNALSAVPSQFWSIMLSALKAFLGIVISAFFLKILINWST